MIIDKAIDIIKEAQENRNLIRLIYRKREDNKVISRIIEPYELKFEKFDKNISKEYVLFGYDTSKYPNKIKFFYLNRIISASIMKNSNYKPRYSVKIIKERNVI